MGHDLGVGLGGKVVSHTHELGFQLEVVFEDAIVNDGYPSGAVTVRVGVVISRPPMGRPPRMAQTDGALHGLGLHKSLQAIHSTRAPTNFEAGCCLDDQPRRVVASVLEPSKSVQQYADSVPRAKVTNDSAHAALLLAQMPETL